MALETHITDVLTKISEKEVQEVSEILGTVINKKVTVSLEGMDEFDFSTVKENYSDSVLMVSCHLSTDPEGIIMVFLEKPLAIKISSWMVMAEPVEELNEEHLDSIKEIANQIGGALAPIIRDELNINIEVQGIESKVVDLTEDIFSYPGLIAEKFKLDINGEESNIIYRVLTSSTVESLIPGKETEEEKPEAEAEKEKGEGEFDLESMLSEAQEEIEDVSAPAAVEEEKKELEKAPEKEVLPEKMELLMDLSFPVSIELGRTKMLIKDILELGHGSVIEFDKLAGEPVDLLINDKKIAEGEVVVIDEHFGIRITSLVKPSERLSKLK
ncbi:flagellar motor switch protein FliN [candidate division KSB1 bacterium]|nr:MAG: flagellar motor switch protein FliN [candidate division KSB1 bacterium]